MIRYLLIGCILSIFLASKAEALDVGKYYCGIENVHASFTTDGKLNHYDFVPETNKFILNVSTQDKKTIADFSDFYRKASLNKNYSNQKDNNHFYSVHFFNPKMYSYMSPDHFIYDVKDGAFSGMYSIVFNENTDFLASRTDNGGGTIVAQLITGSCSKFDEK